MESGKVKWFNPQKGYGFIQPDNGSSDVFVHTTAVEKAGIKVLNEGQPVYYELITSKGRVSADNLKLKND
jgi:cold shock protein